MAFVRAVAKQGLSTVHLTPSRCCHEGAVHDLSFLLAVSDDRGRRSHSLSVVIFSPASKDSTHVTQGQIHLVSMRQLISEEFGR